MAEERTDKLTSGNTVGPTGRSYSISGLGVKGKDPNDSLKILKGSSKATAMVPMIEWATRGTRTQELDSHRQQGGWPPSCSDRVDR